MRDLLSKLDAIVSETALNPKDPKGDYAAKKKALDDLERGGETDRSAIQQRRLDLDKEAESKGVKEDTIFEVGDAFGISFSEDFEIGTEIIDILEDGIVIELDETALEFLTQQGFTFEEGEIVEEKQKGLDGKACWKGYRRMGTKMKGGKRVDNCVKVGEEKSFPFAGKKVGHKEGPAGHLKGKDKRPARAGDLVGEESDVGESGLQYSIGVKKHGKPYMTKAAQLMRDGGSQEELGKLRDQHSKAYKNKKDEDFDMDEAKYQGREVPLGKPMAGDVKKSKVYVKNPQGRVVKVNFGDKKMKIKKSNPKRRKSFRARHNCANPGPRHKARYWSCRAW